MVRVVGLFALTAPVFGARVEVRNQLEADASVAVARGLEVLSLLKETPNDAALQQEYRHLIGDVEMGENQVFLETGVTMEQQPTLLGEMSQSGSVLTMAERTGFTEALGRLLTDRRDYVFEQEGGNSKYVLDGSTLSLHSRMHVSVAGETEPRFVLRRAFNYLNPIASLFGQFIYRVIQCTDAHDGSCSEGDILYTISKDRLGRGALWGMDEYRVYTGTGGCRRWGHGILGCDQGTQVLYSLGAGLSDATFDTAFYKGNILAIHGDGESGTVGENGNEVRVGQTELNDMKIAQSTKTEGPPRWLNWVTGSFPVVGQTVELARALIWTDSYRVRFEGNGGAVDDLLVSLMVAAQDLTRDVIAGRTVSAAVAQQNAVETAAAVSGATVTRGGIFAPAAVGGR